MELIQKETDLIIDDNRVVKQASPFIGANTEKVTLEHLRDDCVVPVFSKDNEVTISHYQFIDRTIEAINTFFPSKIEPNPDIRVSHIIKGRVPTAIGKPVKELLEHEKTIYYERCAFLIELPNVSKEINGNKLNLSIGGVRAYNQENLYSKKSLERFKLFIGFKNKVCTNLCVSTDGISTNIRIGSINELEMEARTLFESYDAEKHLETLEMMQDYSISEEQFGHLTGKMRMYQHMDKRDQKKVFPMEITDGQINQVVKEYYNSQNFSRNGDGSINLWNFYNLLTGSNKSSYIDSFLERGLFAHEFVQDLCNSIKNGTPNWYLNN